MNRCGSKIHDAIISVVAPSHHFGCRVVVVVFVFGRVAAWGDAYACKLWARMGRTDGRQVVMIMMRADVCMVT